VTAKSNQTETKKIMSSLFRWEGRWKSKVKTAYVCKSRTDRFLLSFAHAKNDQMLYVCYLSRHDNSLALFFPVFLIFVWVTMSCSLFKSLNNESVMSSFSIACAFLTSRLCVCVCVCVCMQRWYVCFRSSLSSPSVCTGRSARKGSCRW
jgi:hypothetical protein